LLDAYEFWLRNDAAALYSPFCLGTGTGLLPKPPYLLPEPIDVDRSALNPEVEFGRDFGDRDFELLNAIVISFSMTSQVPAEKHFNA